MALSDAAPVDIRPHGEKPLSARDFPADHPVERATVDKLIGALGNHAGAVQMLGLLGACLSALLADPGLEILDRVTAHAELDEMQCHDAKCSSNRDERAVIAGGRRASSDLREQATVIIAG